MGRAARALRRHAGPVLCAAATPPERHLPLPRLSRRPSRDAVRRIRAGAEEGSADHDAALTTAWDAVNPNRYYFAATNAFDAPSRLWVLDLFDVRHPEWGGTRRALLDGIGGQKMLDNITATADGTVIALEGVGSNPRAGKVWSHGPKTDSLTELARHDEARFGSETAPPTPPFA